MTDPDVSVVLVTAPQPEAGALARTVVEEGLAACANVIPAVTSVYRWEGRVEEDAESLLILKTSGPRLEELRDRVLELHSYDVPEVLVLPVEGGNVAYLDWVRRATGGSD